MYKDSPNGIKEEFVKSAARISGAMRRLVLYFSTDDWRAMTDELQAAMVMLELTADTQEKKLAYERLRMYTIGCQNAVIAFSEWAETTKDAYDDLENNIRIAVPNIDELLREQEN